MNNNLMKIKVIAMDVDGVLTDGRIIYDGNGKEMKFFDVQDGFAIGKARKAGLLTAVISARGCRAVRARTDDLKITKVYLDAYPKIGAYEKMLKVLGVKDEDVCFIGDDLPDLEILSRVGFAAVPQNAAPEVKKVADFIARKSGGRGAVREVIEKILKAQGEMGREVKILWNVVISLIILTASAALAADSAPVSPVIPANSEAAMPQQMEGFNLSGYSDGGQKTWDIKGDKADITGNQVDVTNVNANSYGTEDTNLKARKGRIDKATGDVQLQDDVVITTERGAQMKTETLNWERGNNIVTTDDHVTIEDDTMKIQGEGMEAHPGLKAAKLNKDVSADIRAESKDKKKDNRIQITSDGPMEIDQANQTAVFTDNVEAWEEISDRRLKADKMEVKFDEKTKKIKEIVCTGNVEVHQGKNVTHSDGLIYKADEQRMVLTGKPKLIIDAGDHTMSDALKGF